MIMNQMNQTIVDAFHFRHATKEFDPAKKLVMKILILF